MPQKKVGGQPINPNLRKLTSLIAEAIRKQGAKSGREIESVLIVGKSNAANESGNISADGRTWRRYRKGTTSFKSFARLKSVAVLACQAGWLDRRWLTFFMPGVSEDYILGKSEKPTQTQFHESFQPDPIDDAFGHRSYGDWEMLFDGTTIEIEWAREQWLREIRIVPDDDDVSSDAHSNSGEEWPFMLLRRLKTRTRRLVHLTRLLVNGASFVSFDEGILPDSLVKLIYFRAEDEAHHMDRLQHPEELHYYRHLLAEMGDTAVEEFRTKDFTNDQIVLVAVVKAAIEEMGYDCSDFPIAKLHDFATAWISSTNQKSETPKRRERRVKKVAIS